MSNVMVFSGSSNPPLAERIATHLKAPLGKADVGRFSDSETRVELLENVRGRDIFLVQSISMPANDNLMELIVMADALRRASANKITAVIPYFGYARQDRRVRSARVPITAKVVADMMASVGISRVLTVDLHADQIQGFFYMPVDNAYGTPIMLDDIAKQSYKNIIVVSPDMGGVVRARALAKRIPGADLAIIDKRRPKPGEAEVMHIIGDISGHDCLIVDDIVDTGGTLCKAADALKKAGAQRVAAYVTHPVLSGHAIATLEQSSIEELVVTDTIPLTDAAQECPKIRQIHLCDLLAKAIHRITGTGSLSELFASAQ